MFSRACAFYSFRLMERHGSSDHRSPLRTPPLAERVVELRHFAQVHQWDGLDPASVAALLTDDWLGTGPLHLDETLTLDELAAATILHNVPAVLHAVEPLLASESAGKRYARLFRTYFRTFNLAYTDRFPDLPELQDLVPYWLWVMTGTLGAGFLSADVYVQVFAPDPQRLDRAGAPARLRHLIQKRVLDALADFGLLEPKAADDETEELGDVGFRPTPLFKRFLRFDLPPARPVAERGHLNLLR
jgi:hypothetical protein